MYVCLQKPANKLKVHINGNIYIALGKTQNAENQNRDINTEKQAF